MRFRVVHLTGGILQRQASAHTLPRVSEVLTLYSNEGHPNLEGEPQAGQYRVEAVHHYARKTDMEDPYTGTYVPDVVVSKLEV